MAVIRHPVAGKANVYTTATMILTINAIDDADRRRRFDRVVLPRLRTVAPADFDVVHLAGDPMPPDPGPTGT